MTLSKRTMVRLPEFVYPSGRKLTWCESFVASVLDLKRHAMTDQELCRLAWRGHFPHASDRWHACRFEPNQVFTCDFGFQARWAIQDGKLELRLNNGLTPVHRLYRRNDWGWVISDQVVTYRSELPDDLDGSGPHDTLC